MFTTKHHKARIRVAAGCVWVALATFTAAGQELIYQEDFETDGEAATPQRYTTVGRDVYEVDRIRSELGINDQLGPVYFAHNNEVSYTGVPAPTAARRMAMAWNTSITEADTSPQMLQLFDSAIKWLLNNKANARIIVAPAGASLGVLGERLTAAGHTLVDDDTAVTEEQLGTLGDLLIHSLGAGSRGARAPIPMVALDADEHDDVLTASIGSTVTFEAGKGKIEAPSHPAAGGLTGEFDVATGSFAWELMGDQLPANATVLASFARLVPPTVASLEDVDAMAAGTKQSTSSSGELTLFDINDASEGFSPGGEPPAGGASGIWGMRATGKLNVLQAGTYTLATASDDGARVRVDVNKNGFDAGDTIVESPGPQGNTAAFGNVTFPSTGLYDVEVIGYNSGAGGNIEFWVALEAGGGKNDLSTAPENWEVIGTEGGTAQVRGSGNFQVTIYSPAGDDQAITVPLMVLLNGPNDTPPGSVFGGGPFTGQSGNRFFAGAGMNKWPWPDENNDRYLTLRPIDVTGKENVKLTIAIAGTFLDFERGTVRGTPDYLEVAIDTDGAGPKEFERLIFFTAPSGSVKYVDDTLTNPENPTRLGLQFQDVTYDIPAGATDLVIQLRAASTWWNEIFAFDNIRVTAGAAANPPQLSVKAGANGNVELTFEGVLEARSAVNTGAWSAVPGTSPLTIQKAQLGNAMFYRARRP